MQSQIGDRRAKNLRQAQFNADVHQQQRHAQRHMARILPEKGKNSCETARFHARGLFRTVAHGPVPCGTGRQLILAKRAVADKPNPGKTARTNSLSRPITPLPPTAFWSLELGTWNFPRFPHAHIAQTRPQSRSSDTPSPSSLRSIPSAASLPLSAIAAPATLPSTPFPSADPPTVDSSPSSGNPPASG